MISYYELLGLIKEGKQPKKIKRYDIIYDWTGYNFYNDDYGHLTEHMNELHMINKDIEIIKDKPEKIEKIEVNENKSLGFPNGSWSARNIDIAFASKINELIKAVNYLLDEDKHE